MHNQTDLLRPVLISRRGVLAGVAGTVLAGGVLRGEAAADPSMTDDNILELRQYTLHKGGRDTLIRIFEASFLEPQNAAGAHIFGTFRDLDDPDRFVWLRG